MKKNIMYLVLLLAMPGISGCVSGLSTSTGKKTTVKYDEAGRATQAIDEDVSLSDVSAHYKAVDNVVTQVSVATTAQANAIKDMANASAEKTMSSEAKGLYKAIGMFSIAQLRPDYAAPLAALGKRPMSIIEGVADVAKIGVSAIVGITEAKYLKETIGLVADKAGTSIVSEISGDNNTSGITNKDTKVNTTTHNNTVGDDSPANTNNQQTATGCADGDCNKKSGEPIGWDNGGYEYCTPEFLARIPGCSSCESYKKGRCSLKPPLPEPDVPAPDDPEPED